MGAAKVLVAALWLPGHVHSVEQFGLGACHYLINPAQSPFLLLLKHLPQLGQPGSISAAGSL